MHYFYKKNYQPSNQSVDVLGYQRLVYFMPCLYMGCKRSLVLEMEFRVSVYLIIIIIIHLYIAVINELMGRKTILKPIQFSHTT